MSRPLAERLPVWRAYLETSVKLQEVLDATMRKRAQITMSDYHVLLLLSEAKGRRLRMGELASAMVFSTSRLSYQIQQLERRGLVRRERVAEDARGSWACLTAAGTSALRKAGPAHLALVESLFLEDLDDEESEVLLRVFTRLRERL